MFDKDNPAGVTADGIHLVREGQIIATCGGANSGMTLAEAKHLAAEIALLLKQHGLPYRCECGGKMEYDFDFGRVFSCCDTCSPKTKITITKKKGKVQP